MLIQKKLLILTGKKGTGKTYTKDYVIKELKRKYKGIKIKSFSFAGRLKKECNKLITNLFGKEYLEPDFKELVARKIYQAVGQSGRAINKNFWIHDVRQQMIDSKCDVLIIDDCRFENELLGLDDATFDTTTVRVKRTSIYNPKDNDPTEIGLDHFVDGSFDVVIEDGIESFVNAIKIIVEELGRYM